MKRNIAVITTMMFLFAGISMGAQAADVKAAAEASTATATPAAKKAAPMHKHHVTHHKAAAPAKPADK